MTDIRVGLHPDFTRVVIETDEPTEYLLLQPLQLGDFEIRVRIEADSQARTARPPGSRAPAAEIEPLEGGGSLVRIRVAGPVVIEEQVIGDPPRIVLDMRVVPEEVAVITTRPRMQAGPMPPEELASALAEIANAGQEPAVVRPPAQVPTLPVEIEGSGEIAAPSTATETDEREHELSERLLDRDVESPATESALRPGEPLRELPSVSAAAVPDLDEPMPVAQPAPAVSPRTIDQAPRPFGVPWNVWLLIAALMLASALAALALALIELRRRSPLPVTLPSAVGETGLTGAIGVAGAPGVMGLAGAPGPIGATGPSGPAGITGSPGDPGTPGAPGAVGPVGMMGLPGGPGPPGASGHPGPAGETGPPGPAGEIGPPGESLPGGESPADGEAAWVRDLLDVFHSLDARIAELERTSARHQRDREQLTSSDEAQARELRAQRAALAQLERRLSSRLPRTTQTWKRSPEG